MNTATEWKYKVKNLVDLPTMNFQDMTVQFLIQKSEMPEMAAYHIRMRPNLKIPPSYHKKAREIIIILDGRGTAHLDHEDIEIHKGDVILVKPRTWHSFSTNQAPLHVLAITTPYVDNETDLFHN